MKVLLINGSPHKEGNTALALKEIARTLEKNGIDTEIVHLGTQAMRGCIACGKCRQLGRCVFHDDVYDRIETLLKEGIDGFIVGSPVYYAGPNGSVCALLDRVFYSLGGYLQFKPAASVAVCRRSGATATFDRLNKYFTINNMPVVSTFYWNNVHGTAPGEAARDEEGMQSMRAIGENMTWLLRSISGGKQDLPVQEPRKMTNFIR